MIKSQRFTAYRQNKGKNDAMDLVFSELTWLWDRMSDYIHDNLYCLVTDKTILLKQYAQFTSGIIPAWNVQKGFHFLASLYENVIRKRIGKTALKIQTGIKISRYKKVTRRHKPGDLKEFRLVKKSTKLCKFIKYLIHLDIEKIEYVKNDWFREAFEYYRQKPYFHRILKLAQAIRGRAVSSVKKLNFTGGAVLRPHENHSKIIFDPENVKYKWWFWLKLKNGFNIYLPLQFNNSYHAPDKLIGKEFLIFRQGNKKKVHIVTTCNADDPQFISGMLKWHRLAKLLHLSNVKNAFIRIGEKLGIRIHVSHAAFSSQQCFKCGHIARKNRPTLEKFRCISCGHEDNADHNALMNLKMRLLLDVLRESLHTTDKWNRLRPKRISRSKIKSILEEFVLSCSLPVNGFS